MSVSKAKYDFAIDSLRAAEAKIKELEAELNGWQKWYIRCNPKPQDSDND